MNYCLRYSGRKSVKAHYETLKKEGYTVEQLRDIGRIAAVMNSVAKVLNS
jgi:alkyl hydroperoxide reductase subunit D